MLIPFPLLYKLKIDNQKRWILIGLFALPIIPIMFACLRLAETNNPDHNVDPIKFQLFSMLENTSAIITSCLPAFRLFVINSHHSSSHSGSRSSHRFSRGLSSSFRSIGSSSQGKQKMAIPLESLVETYHDRSVSQDTGTVGGAFVKDSDEESLHPFHSAPSDGVYVKQDFHVK